ncbi:cell division protein FtsQ/DivIB [Leptolyngbya ohadii]|uniref:cell division protein FtsQ/DivIB n=1 Tax=Leptolyngbya ohadii TaxID=1962290 RepID=UPI001CEC4930|nr:FtsQ-type POTRA domain-containing protein [Leptolyngbya ohadii]
MHSVSSAQIAARRRKLRHQRRLQVFRVSWQLLMVGGLTAGLIWVVSLPDWMLRSASQVKVEGNESLSAETIRGLLPIAYPQFLLTLKPQSIVNQLELQAPIAEATVTRRLFPPGLTIRIQERNPVAIVYGGSVNSGIAASSTNPANPGSTPAPIPNSIPGSPAPGSSAELKPTTFLDERGTVIPYDKYMALRGSRPLPTLKVIGIQQDQQRKDWAVLYQQVSQSPVKVFEIDWREPGNMILRTEMGTVHLGAYGSQFSKQLQTLDRMRYLSQKIEVGDIAYIDLRNPDMPRIETTQVVSPIPEPVVQPDADADPDGSLDASPNESPDESSNESPTVSDQTTIEPAAAGDQTELPDSD